MHIDENLDTQNLRFIIIQKFECKIYILKHTYKHEGIEENIGIIELCF